LLKQSLQYTGRPDDGWKGTCAVCPQLLQTTSNIWRLDPPEGAPVPRVPRRAARQSGQRPGSFCRPLAA
jgi:hypothetical protein